MKRFTETNKWSDPWYRRLSPVAKLLWSYLTDNCDCTGLIDFDVALAAFHIGAKIQEKHLAELASRTQRTVDGKIFIPKFIPFQYGALSETCPAHKPVLKLVTLRNISMNGIGYQYPNDRVALEYPYSTGKGKDKEKETEEGEREGEIKPSLVPTAEDIWKAYPKSAGKKEGIIAIKNALHRGFGAAFLLERTIAYTKTQPRNDRFTPNAQKWFNHDRFNDDPESWSPTEHGSSKPTSAQESEKQTRMMLEMQEAREKYGQRRS